MATQDKLFREYQEYTEHLSPWPKCPNCRIELDYDYGALVWSCKHCGFQHDESDGV